MLDLNLSQLQRHPDTRDTTLALATLCWRQCHNYCEPTLRVQPRSISTNIYTLVTINHLQAPTRCSYRQQGTKGDSPSIITNYYREKLVEQTLYWSGNGVSSIQINSIILYDRIPTTVGTVEF